MESKKNIKKSTISIRKLAMAGVLVAVAVAGSLISFPVAGSKCAPVQHMVNICAAVFLGPAWGVGVAFCASIIEPDRTWKPHGIPWKHGRCSVLWTDVQIQQKSYRHVLQRRLAQAYSEAWQRILLQNT